MLEIVEPGALTVVQDGGRWGYESVGIARGGAADFRAYTWANQLAGNDSGAAVLESVLRGPVIRFARATVIATTAIADVSVDGVAAPPWSRIEVSAAATIACKRLERARGYIAVAGGIDVSPVLGSRSTNLEAGLGGWHGRPLQAGDLLPTGVQPKLSEAPRVSELRPVDGSELRLRVVPGPHFDDFSAAAFGAFIAGEYVVSHQSNHIGVRLEGPLIEPLSRGGRLSEPMPIGGIQITPSGQPLVLLGGRGTIGGYPVIATVTTPDVWRLGQVLPGDKVTICEIGMDEARAIALRAYEELGM